jgi:hypothetical protein
MNAGQSVQRQTRIGKLTLNDRRAVVSIAIEDQGFQASFSRLPNGDVSEPQMAAGSGPEHKYRADLEPVFWEAAKSFRRQHLAELDALLPTVAKTQSEEALIEAGVPRERLRLWDGVTLFLEENYTEFHYTGEEAIADRKRHDFGIDLGHWRGRLPREKGFALRQWLDERAVHYTRPQLE